MVKLKGVGWYDVACDNATINTVIGLVFNMKDTTIKIPFKVSARTARLIGRENVANAEAAIIELVKNGYDADSKSIQIIFKGKDLYLIDNGHGMDPATLENGWMVIGTDNKQLSPKTPGGRIRSGAKGIGRFALDKLGGHTVMYTLQHDQQTLKWEVSWENFEKSGKTVDDINASITTLDHSEFERLYKELVGTKAGSGTILHIQKLRDDWNKHSLDKLFYSLQALVPPASDKDFRIDLRSDRFPKKYGSVEPLIASGYDYELNASYDAKNQEIHFEVKRNELDVQLLHKSYMGIYEQKGMGTRPFDPETFKKGSYKGVKSLAEVIPGINESGVPLQGVGDFSFQLIFAKNTRPNDEDVEKYPYRTVDYRERNEWMKKFGGIRIFRDNFRVRPYGENRDDWLRLGERQAQSPGGPGQRIGGYKVRPNQVTGSVYISRLSNTNLEDKSSREGIVENEPFELFKNILKGILTILEEDRNRVFFSLSQLFKETSGDEVIKQRAKEAIAKVKKSEEEKSHHDNGRGRKEEYAERIADYVEVLESQGQDKDEEIKILRSLASAGIITAAAAHELNGLKNHMTVRTRQFEKLLEKYLNKDDFKDKSPAHDPFKRLDQMGESDKKIVSWMDYALMPLRRDRRLRNKINTEEYFAGLEEGWGSLLRDRRIGLKVKTDVPEGLSIKAFPIDLDTIFNNLLINSTEAFVSMKSTEERSITLEIGKRNQKLKIIYEDNAGGLDASFKDAPDRIFMPHITTKVNPAGEVTGTGMGMYLVKVIVDENEGSIIIDNVPGHFKLLIELQVYDGK